MSGCHRFVSKRDCRNECLAWGFAGAGSRSTSRGRSCSLRCRHRASQRVVIGEQAPGEVRVARRKGRKARARHLALTNSCPRDVPSGSIPLGLFPMRSHFGALTSATSPASCRIPLHIDLTPLPRPAAADAAVVFLCSILDDDQDMFSIPRGFQSVSCAELHQAPAGVARNISAEDPGTRHRAISRRLLAQAPGIQTGIHAGLIGQDGKIGIR